MVVGSSSQVNDCSSWVPSIAHIVQVADIGGGETFSVGVATIV